MVEIWNCCNLYWLSAASRIIKYKDHLSPPATIFSLFIPDVAIVDMSDISRQPSLFYHLGVRESFDMANNVILYYDTDADTALSLKVRSIDYLPLET